MYLSHYKLKVKPFQMSTDPKFLWLGEKHKEALAILKYGIFENKGVLAVTGDVGTGKTTLINALVKDLGKDIIVATIYDPGLEPLEFFSMITVSLNMGITVTNKGEFLIHFREFLQKARAENRKVLLIIDEAQRIGPELLEEARLLSNLEAEHIRLLNIFFIGQNEFIDILQEDVNRALRQRIAISYDIKPLTLEETTAYVNHRLRIAGAKTPIFTPGAIQEIFDFASGYPRLINIICDHALLSGFVKGVQSINGDIIRECKNELHVSEWISRHGKDIERKHIDQEQRRDIQEKEHEEPKEEQDGVRLARGLYQKAPTARPDKMPVGLAIISVVLILLIAAAAGYIYYKPGKKAKLSNAISFKKEGPAKSKPTGGKEDEKYLVPFIPESKEQAVSGTGKDVVPPRESDIQVTGQSHFEEVAAKDTAKPVAELKESFADEPEKSVPEVKQTVAAGKQNVQSEKKGERENVSMALASAKPAATVTPEKKSDSIKKTAPETEKPGIQSKKKEVKPQPIAAKEVSASTAGFQKDDRTVKPVVSKETPPEKKALPKNEVLSAHVDRDMDTDGLQNKGAVQKDEQKILKENLETRLKTFLASYSQAYENRRLDEFAGFFAPDAVENGKPFSEQLPKYRRNFDRIDALDYNIKMDNYSINNQTGLISIDGTYVAKAKVAGGGGEWRQSSGGISLALEAYGDTYRIKRLGSMDRSPKATPVSGGDLLTRLNTFLKAYSKAYENKRLDEFAAFFTADATEKGESFRSQLPKYRRNFEMIDAMDYQIDLKRYSVQEGSGLIRLEGVANLRTKFAGADETWRESSTGIFMELAAYGNSFRIRRLDY